MGLWVARNTWRLLPLVGRQGSPIAPTEERADQAAATLPRGRERCQGQCAAFGDPGGGGGRNWAQAAVRRLCLTRSINPRKVRAIFGSDGFDYFVNAARTRIFAAFSLSGGAAPLEPEACRLGGMYGLPWWTGWGCTGLGWRRTAPPSARGDCRGSRGRGRVASVQAAGSPRRNPAGPKTASSLREAGRSPPPQVAGSGAAASETTDASPGPGRAGRVVAGRGISAGRLAGRRLGGMSLGGAWIGCMPGSRRKSSRINGSVPSPRWERGRGFLASICFYSTSLWFRTDD